MARIFTNLPIASKKDVIKALESGQIGHICGNFAIHESVKPIWGKSPMDSEVHRNAQRTLNLLAKNVVDSIR